MHNPESFLENEVHNILWNFEIQTDHLISIKRLDQVVVKKKKKKKKKENLPNIGVCCSHRPQSNIRRK